MQKIFIVIGLALAFSVSSAHAGPWEDLVEGRNVDRWRDRDYGGYETREEPDPEDYMTGHIEPGHIPYPCDGITGNPRARADCQRGWDAHNPNDYLHYGR